ncbi:MAG TPA: hypothetical protein ENI46_03605, partial [Firmicutes bacterium]|nr:hypothetical protein [Bacillota bacterium]
VMTVALATSSKFLKPFYLVFPVLRFSQIDRISVIACFSLSALAGISFSLINKVSAHCRKRFVLILIGLVCAVLIGYVVLTLNHASIMAGIEEQARRLGDEFWQSPASREIARWLNSGDSQWLGLELGSIKLSLVMLLACVALLAGYALQQRRRTFTRAVAIIFVGLAIGDLLSTARSYYVSQPSGSLDETQGISLLKAAVRDEAGWRIGHFSDADNTFPTNVNEIFEIPSISGRSTLVPEGFARFAIAERQIKDLEVVDEPLRSSLRLQNIASVRYLVGDTLYPQMLRSPILAKLATLGSEPEMVSLDGERMLAFELDPGKPTRLDVWLLDIDRLDWILGVEGDDSVYVGINISNLRTLSVVKGLAGGCWQRFSIDISKLASGYCTLEIGVTPRGRAPVRCYLAQADLVVGDCTIEPLEGGYTIGRLKPEETLVLDVVSQKPLVRLNLDLGRARFTRYLTFPAGTARRQLALQLGEDQAELKVSGDGDFEIVDARMVRISQAGKPQFEILSTRDMVILENTAAVRKGILIPDSVTRMVFKRRPLLEWDIASTLTEPGSCDLIDYRPEYIEAQIGCPQAGYFIIQDVYYPGWKAYLDGRRVDIVETIGGMRAVRVEKGEHRLVMKYQPSTLKLGIGLAILGLVLGTFYVRKSS